MPVTTESNGQLTQLEWTDADFEIGEAVAKKLGYEQTAYTSTSALWGLFCLPENPEYAKRGQATRGGCVIKTKELGFLFVQTLEDVDYQLWLKAEKGGVA
jgi:hypothetical protein